VIENFCKVYYVQVVLEAHVEPRHIRLVYQSYEDLRGEKEHKTKNNKILQVEKSEKNN
jgi:hypothetical protein